MVTSTSPLYPGTMATADSTTSTHDEGECWEEDLHSLSCSEDEDRGELVYMDTFHIKHTAASQCSIIHRAVWTMRKNFYIIFYIHAEMQSCADTEWNRSIMGWVWLLVPLR